jgi:hypothetical protein
MSGSGSGSRPGPGPERSGSGSGGGGNGGGYFTIGGINVSIPYIDTSIPYAHEVQDISLCIAILQMTSYIENKTISGPIQSAAAQALRLESQELAQETIP